METEFEAYVELSAELTAGLSNLTQAEQKMCFRTEQIYSTSSANPLLEEGSGDIYIGASVQYIYGLFKTLRYFDCQVDTVKQLAFGLGGTQDQFVYPESYIVNTVIPDLEELLSTLEVGSNPYIHAQDQLEVWQQYVQMNQAIKQDALENQLTPEGFNFVAGTNYQASKSTTTAQTRSVEMNLYVDASLGFEVGAEVAGTGGSLGAKIRTKIDRGSETNSSNTHTSTISYEFVDDDVESAENPDPDAFFVSLYEDPVFGTPIFILDEDASQSSCPYEGGYQMDQPNLIFDDGTTDLVLENIPNGTITTFEIDICNESNFAREYFIKVPLESNLSGLQLELGGVAINPNDGITTNLIPANSCLENAVITVSQPEGSSILDFEDIQIVMFSPCQPSFAPTTSIVTLDAHFTTGTSVLEQSGSESAFAVSPNPNDGNFMLSLNIGNEYGIITIEDISGKTVERFEITGIENISLDLSDLSKGLYVITMYNQYSKFTEKMIIR